MPIRQTMPVLILFALIGFIDADAAIYKWKDENRETHFTDDPTKVPEEFRKKPFIKGTASKKFPPKPEKKKAQIEN